MTEKKIICPHCGEELILDPVHGKLMVHKDAGNYFCIYGEVKRNGNSSLEQMMGAEL